LRTHSWRRLGKSAKSGGSSAEKFCAFRDLRRLSIYDGVKPSCDFYGVRNLRKIQDHGKVKKKAVKM
jgi:hypothetical protein